MISDLETLQSKEEISNGAGEKSYGKIPRRERLPVLLLCSFPCEKLAFDNTTSKAPMLITRGES